MATKKAPYTVKGKFWTEIMTADFEGPMKGVIIDLFRWLPSDQRQYVLDKLTAYHAEKSRKEEEANAKGDAIE